VTHPLVVAVSGFSGSGKTRLLARLIPALARRGVTTAVVKHTRHPHAFDRPGKDTDVLRRAGAAAAAIDGPGGMAFFGPPAGGLRALLSFLPPVDLVLAEGWKDAPAPRIEVHRRRVGRPFLCAEDPRVFAVVTDEPPPRRLHAFGHEEVAALAALVCARFGLGRPARKRASLRVGPAVSSLGAKESGIGRKGGKKSGARRRASARRSSRMTAGRARSRSRSGSRSRRGGRASSR
jgi:molybdopterin-guanine dinucleotide biosynthesis protein B